MTYRNQSLRRKPAGMLRANPDEQEALNFLVEHYGGGEAAAIWRQVLIERAEEIRHEKNSLRPSRLDRNAFGGLLTA